MPRKSTHVSIDDRLAEWRESEGFPPRPAVDIVHYETVTLFGEEFRIAQSLNYWGVAELLDEEDGGAISRFVLGRIHPEDRPRWKRTLSMQTELMPGELAAIVNAVMEVASGSVPTPRPNGSTRSAAKRAAITQSAAG